LRLLLQEFTAGDPMRTGVLGTNLSLRELSRRLIAMGTPASRRTIRRLLRQLKLGQRTARKKKSMGHHPDRNAQFDNLARLRREYQNAGDPVISIDTKKKELLGNFHRDGRTFTEQTVETFEAEGMAAALGRVVLTGQALRVPQLAEQVQQHLNVPTVSLSSFERCTLAPGLVPDDDPLHQVAWASLVGLALGRSEVDLTPPTLKLHRAFEIRTRALVGAAYQVIALLLLSACVIMGQSFKSERYYSGLVRQHTLRSQEIQELERLVERLAIVKEWQRGQGQLLEAVMAVEAHTPAAIQWDTLTYAKNQQLTLKGVSAEMPKVFEFAELVKQSPLFTHVEARRVTKRKVEDQDLTEFELVCALHPSGESPDAEPESPGG
jgi:Tfp pilus assembly PilM family ATPase